MTDGPGVRVRGFFAGAEPAARKTSDSFSFPPPQIFSLVRGYANDDSAVTEDAVQSLTKTDTNAGRSEEAALELGIAAANVPGPITHRRWRPDQQESRIHLFRGLV